MRSNLSAIRRRTYALGRQSSRRLSTPAPIRGWNTRDGANEITPEECYDLQNWIPDVGGLVLRPGYGSFYEGSGIMYSLLVWSSGTNEKLLASTETTLFEVGGSETVTGLLGGYWSGAMMNDRLGLVNGVDAPRQYDGNVVTNLSISGHPEPNRLVGLKIFKSRSYFWDDGLAFWYSQPNALGGVLTKFPLTTVAQNGGRIMSINAWTRDAGAGVDDFLVITTSKGEVIVYAGSNPSDANDWALVGRYYIAEPISHRGFLELDGKLYVLTKNDLETLPDRFYRQTVPPTPISKAVREAYQNNQTAKHWKLAFDAKRQLVIANIPVGLDSAEQYVMAPRGYTRFTRMPAYDFTMYRGNLYWTGKGREPNYILVNNVDLLAWSASPLDLVTWTGGGLTTNHHIWQLSGASDNGDFIYFDARTGYSFLRTNEEKRVAMYRPQFVTQGTLLASGSLAFDFSNVYQGESSLQQDAEGLPWGSEWDSSWTQSSQQRGEWIVGTGTGQSVSLRVQGLTRTPLQWSQTDWEIVVGGRY